MFVVVSIPAQGKMEKYEAAILSMLKIVSLSSWSFLSSFSKWLGTADIVAKPTVFPVCDLFKEVSLML